MQDIFLGRFLSSLKIKTSQAISYKSLQCWTIFKSTQKQIFETPLTYFPSSFGIGEITKNVIWPEKDGRKKIKIK